MRCKTTAPWVLPALAPSLLLLLLLLLVVVVVVVVLLLVDVPLFWPGTFAKPAYVW